MSRLRQVALCDAHVAAHALACDAWSALDRLAQLTPEQRASVYGVVLALEHKIIELKGGRDG